MLEFFEEMFAPIMLPLLFTGFLYFTFEVVGPYGELIEQEKARCETKGGSYSARDRACFMKVI